MFQNSYVASRLGVWRQHGQLRLKNLLAKMGYALEQCSQQYSSMVCVSHQVTAEMYSHLMIQDVELRKDLPSQVAKCAPEFGLKDCFFPSFIATMGLRQQVAH